MNTADLIVTIEKTLPILLGIFITVFCLVVLARIVFIFLLNQAYKRYLALKESSKKLLKFSSKKKFIKEAILRRENLYF